MANSDPLIGKQVGNYHILAEINSGSFGSVYRGKHIIFEDDPVVAIKLLHASLHTQQERTEFIKEAQLLKKLRHPYILRILDAGLQENIPYLVTEYAAGGSLRDRLRKYNGQPLPIEEAIAVLTQIGQALHYVNQQHIVHRDLKPENILFNDQGEALLADFGIAVLLTTTHTRQVGLGGTPLYMAPEQFEGLASAKSDQYALGCIAYELVTGHRLFSIANPSLEAYWYHHVKVEPVPPTHFHPQLPTHIERAILTALAKDRAQRHTDVSAFTKALTKGSEGWLDEAKTHLNAKRYEEALVACEQAIRLDPNDAWAYNIKGATLFSLQRYQEALVAVERAIYLDPSYAPAYTNKGGVLNNLKRYEEALATHEQAIRLDPNDAWAYTNKGIALNNLKRYEEVLAACEQAIRLDPNNAVAYDNKGNALQKLGREKEAERAFAKARQLESIR